MAAEDQIPWPWRPLLDFTREIIAFLRRLIQDPALLASVRRELNLPPSATPLDQTAIDKALREHDEKLQAADAAGDKDFALDQSVLDLLAGGRTLVDLLEVVLPGKSASDPRTYAEIAYTFATIFASEWFLRPRAPLVYALLRLVMFGYEQMEVLPGLDPFQIFDRLTGRATTVSSPGFGAMEAVGGLLVPLGVILTESLVLKSFSSDEALAKRGLAKGAHYLKGDLTFKMGWEPSPDLHPELEALLARALTIAYTGSVAAYEEPGFRPLTIGPSLTAMALAAEDGGPGLLLRLGGQAELELELPPGARGRTKRTFSLSAKGGPGADFLWKFGDSFQFVGESGGSPTFAIGFGWKGEEATPAFRLGKADGSRLDVVGFKVGASFDERSNFGFLEFSGGEVELHFADLIPLPPVQAFFAGIGADKIGGKFEGKLKYSAHEGLVFEGEASLKARLATNASLFPGMRLDYLDLEAGPADGGLKLGLEAAAQFKIGPFTANVDRTGFSTLVAKGSDSKLQIRETDFQPPKGIGLKIELPLASGGGFLLLDPEKGEFAGVFELSVGIDFSVKAIVILTTKVPDGGAPFALFVMGFVRIPGGLELGFRFTLNALGVLIGFQHGFDLDALIDGLPNGAMDDVLFPDDPVGDAPRILASLRKIFPIRPGALTLGFMLEVGWGSDYLCSLRLGLILPLVEGKIQEVDILGRVEVTCFKDFPKSLRMQLIIDVAGSIRFSPLSFEIFGHLRDSKVGFVSVQGDFAASLSLGDPVRFILAAGGFHPHYQDAPERFRRPMERIGMTYDIGIVKTWFRGYFAIAPGTLQFGAELGFEYRLGPLSAGAEIGFDALIRWDPDFSFEAHAHASAGVRYRGHTLLGVDLDVTLWGPGQWRIKGHGSFTILFWDVSISIDEHWGDQPALATEQSALELLVLADLGEKTNWRLELPQRADALASLAPVEAAPGETVAHPQATLSYRQKRVPFGLELQHYGAARISGRTFFPQPQLTTGEGAPLGGQTVLTEQFAVGEYLDLPEEDRLSKPGFQAMAAGVATSSDGYAVPAPTPVPFEYEEVFENQPHGRVRVIGMERGGLLKLVGREASGKSKIRAWKKFTDPQREPVRARDAGWIVVEPGTLRPAAGAPVLEGWAAAAPAMVRATAGRGLLVVENTEAHV